MPELRVVLPHRGRPHNLRRFVDGFVLTATIPADLTVVMDDDDSDSLAVELPDYVERIVLPHANVGPKVNHAALRHLDDARAIMYLGDDNVFRTQAWDAAVLRELDKHGGSGFVTVNDLGSSHVCTNIAISTDIVRALGYFDEPSMAMYFVDNVWTLLATETGSLYRTPDDVVIEHMHHIFGKSPIDHIYINAWNDLVQRDSDVFFKDWLPNRSQRDIAIVRETLRAVVDPDPHDAAPAG